MEIKDSFIPSRDELNASEKLVFVEPKLAFVEPELVPQGDVANVTAGFFGTFSP